MKKIETKYIVAVIISLIIGGSILGYGYLDYKYKKDALEQKVKSEQQEKIDRINKEATERQIKDTRQTLLQNCLDEISERFTNATKDRKSVPAEEAKLIVELYQKQRDECFKKYSE